ncbi:MAG: hypothetical protein Q8M37_14625 [Nevskia sp.]|nr:hypothetical protein [Nevskia sp.]
MNRSRRLFAALVTVCGLMTACSSTPVVTPAVIEQPSGPVIAPAPVLPKVALALGGGAVIAPDVHGIKAADFESKQRAILAGEKVALAAVPAIRAIIAARTH